MKTQATPSTEIRGLMTLKRCLYGLIGLLAFVICLGEASAVTITRTSATNAFHIDTSKVPYLTSAYASYIITNDDGMSYHDLWVQAGSFSGGAINLNVNEDGLVNLGSFTNGQTRAVFFYLSATGAVASAQSHVISVYEGNPAYGGTLLTNQSFTIRSVQETIAANANKVNIVVYGPEPPTLGGIVTIEVDGDTGTLGSAKVISFTPAAYANWRPDAYEMIESVITFSSGNTGAFTNQLLIPTDISWNTVNTHYVAVYKFRAVSVTERPTSVSPVGYISSGTQIKHTGTGNFGGLSQIQPAENTTIFTLTANTNQLFAAGTVTYTLTLSNSGTNDAFFDRFENELPAGAAYVPSSTTYSSVPYGEPFFTGQLLTWGGYFTVPAGTSRSLVFQASYTGTPGSYTNSAAAFTQGAQIDTTLDTTDNAPGLHVLNVYTGPNVAPVANNDSTTTLEDVAVQFNVTANDTDANGNIDRGTVDLDPGSPGWQASITNAFGIWSVDNAGLVSFTPATDFTGDATVTYTVQDTAGLSSGTATLTITVTAQADAPTLNAISNMTINEDAGLQTINLSGITTGSGSQVTITASSSNTSIVPHPTVNYTSPNATGSVSFTPVANAHGTVTITLTAQHNGGIAGGGEDTLVRTFTVVVNPVNDVPSFTKGLDIGLNRSATNPVTFANWASNISPGPANETNQFLTFLVSDTNSSFFATGGQPTINNLGTLTFQLAGVAGTNTITVQLKDDGGTANGGVDTSASQTFVIRSSAAGLIPATGGTAISATSAAPSTAWTALTGPKYLEAAPTNVTVGTIVLHAPAGFEFDTNTLAGPAPTVLLHTIFTNGSYADSRNINDLPHGAAIAVTRETNRLTLTIIGPSESSGVNVQYNSLTWTNVRVRPLLGTPLRSGFITNSGTSTLAQVSPGVTSWGPLAMVAGPAAALQIFAQPSSTATAGQAFAQQPIIRIVDSAGNWLYDDNTTQITVARYDGAGTLQGTTTLTAVGGEVRYTNLSHQVVGTINLQFSSAGLPSVYSSDIQISAGAAANLAIQTQPSPNATAGVNFTQQPVIRIEDAYGNLITTNTEVTVVRNAGSGTLQGTTTVTAVNGIATFTGLHHLVAGTINLLFTSPGLNSATSQNIVISPAAASKLTIGTQPSSTATAGENFAQQPVIRVEDVYGNLITSDNTTQITVVRDVGSGALQGTTTLTVSGGVATFTDLSHEVAGIIDLTFTSNTGLTPVSSNDITILPSDPAALVIEVQPSARATVNTVFPDQPVIVIVDAYGNWVYDANTNEVTVVRNAGSGTLQGTTTLTAIEGIVVYTNLSHGVLGAIDLLFTSEGLNSVISEDIVITPEISQLIFATQPSDTAAGAIIGGAGGVVVQLADSNGDPVAAAGVDITVSLFTGSGLLHGTLTLPTDSSGQVVYTDLSMTVVGIKSLEAVSETLGKVSDAFTITAGAPATVVFVSQPSDAITGNSVGDVTVLVTDAYGNPVSGVNVTISLDSGSGGLGGTLTLVTDASGQATFSNVSVNQPGTKTLQATSGAASAISDPFDITTVSPTKLTFIQQPTDTVAGQLITPSVTVQLEDDSGNDAAQEGVSITLTLTSGSGTLLGTVTILTDASGRATFSDLSLEVTGTKQLTATSTALTPALSENFVITAAPPAQLAFVQQPTDAVAGETIGPAVTVQLQDAFGNSISQAEVPITIALTTGAGTLSGTLTVDTDSNGLATFNDLSVDLSGIKNLTVSSTGLTSDESDDFLISAAAASQLAFVQQPTDSIAGQSIAPAITVQLKDAFGNNVSQAGVSIAVALTTGSGALSGTLIDATDANGVATFADLSINLVGTKQLTASSAGLSSDQSDNFVITAAAATQVVFVQQPSDTVAGETIGPSVTVQLQDAFGNPVITAGVPVTLNISSGTGALGGTVTVNTDANGLATFSNLEIETAGVKELAASSPGLSPDTSDPFTISPAAAAGLAISTQPSVTAIAGVDFAQQPVVRVVDAFGNTVTSDNGTQITVARNDGSGTLQGTTTVTVSAGIATFADLSHNVAGTIDLIFTSSPTLGSVVSEDIVISPAAAVGLAIVTQPSETATAGVGFVQQPVVRLVDAFGNTVTSDNATEITVARNDGSGTLQGTTTVTVSGGIATFTDLHHTVAGTIDLVFTSNPDVGSVISGDIVISPAAPAKLVFVQQPTDTVAGETIGPSVAVQLQDEFGNPVPMAGVPVTITLTSGTGILNGTITVNTDASGVATFNNLEIEAAGLKELTASSTGLTSETSDPFTISPAAAAALAIVTQPSSTAIAGAAFATQPVVAVVDAFGNTITGDNATQITVARNDGAGVLQGTTTVTVSSGNATFTDLYHSDLGIIDLVFTSSPDVGSVISEDILVGSAVPSRLAIQTQPSPTAYEDAPFGTQPVIRIEDQFGNLVSDDNTTVVTATVVAGDGTLLGIVVGTAVNGMVTFTDLAYTRPGDIQLIFSSNPVLETVTSSVVTIIAVNDAPIFTLTTLNVETLEDSGPQTFEIASLVDAGAPDESWQNLTITVTNDEPSIFLVQPQITAGGVLTYTLNPDVSGVAQVTVTIVDNGGTDNGGVDTTVVNFAITALPVNDQPTFIKSADVFLPTTTRVASLTNYMNTLVAGPEDESGQSMVFSVTNDSPWAFVVQPTLDVNGTLNFEVDSSVSNLLATVSVVLQDDGGTDNGGIDTSITQTFRIALSSYYNYPRGNTFTNLAGPAGMWLGNLRGTAQWRDIITANYSNNTVSVRLWKSAGIFSPATNYPVGPQPVAVRAVNLNSDAYEDVVCANYGTNTISVLLNLRNGSLGAASHVTIGTTPNPGPIAITLGDANKDGFMDVFTANYLENTVTVLLGTGDGFFGSITNFSVGTGPSSIHVIDMNNDGHVDILTANRTAGTLTILHGLGNGTFTSGQTITLFSEGDPQPIYALPSDLDGDGALDIVTANYASNSVSILLQQGDKSFAVFTNYAVGRNPRSLLVRDLNHDGYRDLAVVNYGDASLQVLLSNGDGSFEYGEILATGLNPTIVVGSNFNDDMTTDFVVSNFGDGSLSLFRYTGPVTYNQFIDIGEDVPRTFALNGRVTSYLGSTTNYVILTQPTNGVVSLIGVGPNVTYTPDQNYFGPDTFTYRAEYMVGDVLLQSGTSTVSITVRPFNDRPTFALSSEVVTVPEESGMITVPNFVTDISVGPENESDQTGTFTVTTPSTTAFKVKPSIDPSGTLTFQPSLNFVGTVNVTVRLRDSGPTGTGNTNLSTASVFQVVVTPLAVKQLKGVYNGLFYENTAISHHSSGYFTFTMASTRNFTGKLMVDGQTLLFASRFDDAGQATTIIPRISRPAVTLELALDLVSGTDQVTGMVSSDGWAAPLLGDRQVFNTITNRAGLAGKYTLVLPGASNDPELPAGDGYGMLTISAAGLIKFNGALGDGTAVGQGTAVSKNGYWPLYLSRYSGKGSLVGWVQFTNRATSSFEGDINWIRPRTTAKLYTVGFTNEVRMLGSTYTPPTNAVRFVNLTNAQVTLTGGNLLNGLTNNASLSLSNLLSFSGTNGISLTVNPLSGYVTGSFTNPATRKRITVRAVGLQKQEAIRGWFLGTNQSGAIRIENKQSQ